MNMYSIKRINSERLRLMGFNILTATATQKNDVWNVKKTF